MFKLTNPSIIQQINVKTPVITFSITHMNRYFDVDNSNSDVNNSKITIRKL